MDQGIVFFASEGCKVNTEYKDADTGNDGYLNGCYGADGAALDTDFTRMQMCIRDRIRMLRRLFGLGLRSTIPRVTKPSISLDSCCLEINVCRQQSASVISPRHCSVNKTYN